MNSLQNEISLNLENPFFHRGPIRNPRYFFGRTRETRQALQMLRNGQCVSIVGPRRIGKTSLLFHLCDSEVQNQQGIGEEYLLIFINCEGLGNLNKSQFYQWLWDETKRALAQRGEENERAEGITNLSDFRELMFTMKEKGYKPVFLLDEFEAIAQNPNFDQDLFSDLRSLVPTVVFVTASQDSLFNLTYADRSVLSSPFFNIFSPLWLGLIQSEESRGFIESMLAMTDFEGFDEIDLTFLHQLAGPHLFFLQIASYFLFEEKTERPAATAQDHNEVRRQFTREAESHFKYAWTCLSEDEQEALRLIGTGLVTEVTSEVKDQLERKCLVYQDDIFSSTFAEFVGSHYEEDPVIDLLHHLDRNRPIGAMDLAAEALLTPLEAKKLLSHLVSEGFVESSERGYILSERGEKKIATDRRRGET